MRNILHTLYKHEAIRQHLTIDPASEALTTYYCLGGVAVPALTGSRMMKVSGISAFTSVNLSCGKCEMSAVRSRLIFLLAVNRGRVAVRPRYRWSRKITVDGGGGNRSLLVHVAPSSSQTALGRVFVLSDLGTRTVRYICVCSRLPLLISFSELESGTTRSAWPGAKSHIGCYFWPHHTSRGIETANISR